MPSLPIYKERQEEIECEYENARPKNRLAELYFRGNETRSEEKVSRDTRNPRSADTGPAPKRALRLGRPWKKEVLSHLLSYKRRESEQKSEVGPAKVASRLVKKTAVSAGSLNLRVQAGSRGPN